MSSRKSVPRWASSMSPGCTSSPKSSRPKSASAPRLAARGDEGPAPPRALVDGLGDELPAAALVPQNQHGHGRGRDLRDDPVHVHHRRGGADEQRVAQRPRGRGALPEGLVLHREAPPLRRAAQAVPEAGHVDGPREAVIRPLAHELHDPPRVARVAQRDHRQLGALSPQRAELLGLDLRPRRSPRAARPRVLARPRCARARQRPQHLCPHRVAATAHNNLDRPASLHLDGAKQTPYRAVSGIIPRANASAARGRPGALRPDTGTFWSSRWISAERRGGVRRGWAVRRRAPRPRGLRRRAGRARRSRGW